LSTRLRILAFNSPFSPYGLFIALLSFGPSCIYAPLVVYRHVGTCREALVAALCMQRAAIKPILASSFLFRRGTKDWSGKYEVTPRVSALLLSTNLNPLMRQLILTCCGLSAPKSGHSLFNSGFQIGDIYAALSVTSRSSVASLQEIIPFYMYVPPFM
jgi:hypothetical protein